MKLFIHLLLGFILCIGIQEGHTQPSNELANVLNSSLAYAGLKPYWCIDSQNRPQIDQILTNNQIPSSTNIEVLENRIQVIRGVKGQENKPFQLIIKKVKLHSAKARVKFNYNQSVTARMTLKRKGRHWVVSTAFIKEVTRDSSGKKQKRFTWDF